MYSGVALLPVCRGDDTGDLPPWVLGYSSETIVPHAHGDRAVPMAAEGERGDGTHRGPPALDPKKFLLSCRSLLSLVDTYVTNDWLWFPQPDGQGSKYLSITVFPAHSMPVEAMLYIDKDPSNTRRTLYFSCIVAKRFARYCGFKVSLRSPFFWTLVTLWCLTSSLCSFPLTSSLFRWKE